MEMEKAKQTLADVFLRADERPRFKKKSMDLIIEAMHEFANTAGAKPSTAAKEEPKADTSDYFLNAKVEESFVRDRVNMLAAAIRDHATSSRKAIPIEWVREINHLKERLEHLIKL